MAVVWYLSILALIIGSVFLIPNANVALADAPLQAGQDVPQPDPNAFELRFTHYYKQPENITNDALAKDFNFFIFSKGNESFRDDVIAKGGRKPILVYTRFEAIHNPGPDNCTAQPWRNNAAYNPGDFCDIRDNHSDWFLRDSSGSPIIDTYNGEEFYLMDPMNTGWQQYFIERMRQTLSDPNWAGLFLDNVETTLSFREKDNEVPPKYPTDAAYWAANQSFLKVMYETYFKPNGKLLYANIVSRKDETLFPTYLTYLDGAMHEGWSIDNPNRWRPVSTWEKQMTLAEQSLAMGKFMVLVGQGQQTDYELQQFAYASFLLVTNGNAAFRYGNSINYRQAWVYDNYKLNLGAPLGPRYKDGTVWRRNYSNGSVMVDPSNHLSEIKLNGSPVTVTPLPPSTTQVPPTATKTATSVPPTASATPTKTGTPAPTLTSTPRATTPPLAPPAGLKLLFLPVTIK